MRDNVLICCLVLLLGCQTPEGVRERAWIMGGLEKRVTPDEARLVAFRHIDTAIKQDLALNTDGGREEAETLAKLRQNQNSKLDWFLGRCRDGDEIWTYRYYLTPDRRGGESGLAILRKGVIVEHKVMLIYD